MTGTMDISSGTTELVLVLVLDEVGCATGAGGCWEVLLVDEGVGEGYTKTVRVDVVLIIVTSRLVVFAAPVPEFPTDGVPEAGAAV